MMIGRHKGHSLAAALKACADVGGELEETARRVLLAHVEASRNTTELGERLGCSARNAYTVLRAFGTSWDTAIADLTHHSPRLARAS